MILGGSGFIAGIILGRLSKFVPSPKLVVLNSFFFLSAIFMVILGYYLSNYSIIVVAGSLFGISE